MVTKMLFKSFVNVIYVENHFLAMVLAGWIIPISLVSFFPMPVTYFMLVCWWPSI